MIEHQLSLTGALIKGGFMDLNSILDHKQVSALIVTGQIDYRKIKDTLVDNAHEELPCSRSGIVWDPLNNLKKTCIYNKKGDTQNDPNYKFGYKIRDFLTTLYARSFEDKSQKMRMNTRNFSIRIAHMFNNGLDIFINQLNEIHGTNIKQNQIRVLYKGGNVISTFTRILYEKLQYTRSSIINRLIENKYSELKRGDWDYSLYIDHNIPSEISMMARTFILFLLQSIKYFMDHNDIFQFDLIAKTIQAEFFGGSEVAAIIDEYRSSLNIRTSIESINVPHKIITANSIIDAPDPDIDSKYSYKRDSSITDTFKINSLVSPEITMSRSAVSIGFIESIVGKKTYLISDFDLARVKINNRITFRMNDQLVVKNMSADLIDMSFINPADTKSDNIHRKIELLNVSEFNLRRVNGYDVPFLSPHYLFYDLCNMLIEEGAFPWEDKKYAKRLDRLINMGLLSSLIINSKEKTSRDIAIALKLLQNIDIDNMENSYRNMDAITSIKNYEPSFSGVYNHFTQEIVKSAYKTLLFIQYGRNNITDPEKIEYIKNRLIFIFNGESNATLGALSRSENINEFRIYLGHVIRRLNEYMNNLNTINRDIQLNDTDPIMIDKV